MESKCNWCGENLTDITFLSNEVSYCSQECYKETRFANSKLGRLYQISLVPIFIILLFFGLGFPVLVLVTGYIYGGSTNFPTNLSPDNNLDYFKLYHKIITPYIITATSLLPILLLSIDYGKYIKLPSRLISKITTNDAMPYWIIIVNYIYIMILYVKVFFFGLVRTKNGPSQIPTTEFFGWLFNTTIANCLLLASIMSLLVLFKTRMGKRS